MNISVKNLFFFVRVKFRCIIAQRSKYFIGVQFLITQKGQQQQKCHSPSNTGFPVPGHTHFKGINYH